MISVFNKAPHNFAIWVSKYTKGSHIKGSFVSAFPSPKLMDTFYEI
jgi:hypothetical protein